MTPILFTLSSGKHLLIIPDTQAHLGGHTIITYTYNLYVDRQNRTDRLLRSKETNLHLANKTDPDYCGFITFEKPGALFSYTCDGMLELDPGESQEVIEHLNSIREDGGWKNSSI